MTDTITPTALASGGLAATLGLSGISPMWLLMAFIGALALQAFATSTITKTRAIVQVACSSVLGALIGASLAFYGAITYEPIRLLLCALGGFGAYPIMQRMLKRGVEKND